MAKKTDETKADDTPAKGTGYFQVSLQHGPVDVVQAKDETEAYAVYREKQGIVSSQYPPVIVPCDPPPSPPAETPAAT